MIASKIYRYIHGVPDSVPEKVAYLKERAGTLGLEVVSCFPRDFNRGTFHPPPSEPIRIASK